MTCGLTIPKIPLVPWNAHGQPGIPFGNVDTEPILAEILPVNFGLAQLSVTPIPLTRFLQPQRVRPYYEMSKIPAVVRQPMIPPKFFQISGQTKDSTGVALGNCTVKLFVTATDVRIESLTSNADGYFYLKSPAQSAAHYAVMYRVGSPDVAGTTVNTLTGV